MSWPVVDMEQMIEGGLIQLGRGRVISKKDIAATPGQYPIYSSARLNNGKFGEYGHFMFDEELITWSVDGGGSFFYRPKHRFSVTNVGGTLRVLDQERIQYKYLYYVLAYKHSLLRFDWTSKAHPSVIRRLYSAIPLPPFAEQKRIAGILDAADALRAKRRESLVQLDTLLQSTFLDMFGDPVTNPMGWKPGRLSDIVERLDGGKNVAQSETATDFRVLKVSAVTYGQYRPEESKYLPADFQVPESYIVRKGDLLISRANTVELIGATAYVWETPENIALPDKIWKFIWKKNPAIEPLFIYHLSRDAGFRRILGRRASGTSGSMKNIAKPKLLGLPIPLPPLDLQQRFAAIVESVEQQKTNQRAHLAELDTLFASLQSRAFRGDL